MGGGNQRMIYNFRERLISDDDNRAQRFLALDRAEIWKHLLNVKPATTFDYGGSVDAANSFPTSIETPLRADIFRGLTVLPIAGTTSLHVVPGVVGMWDKDGLTGSSDPAVASDDDSDYKIVKTDGINTNGVLTIAANAGPGLRIDVVECQRTETVTETDSRDIFAPSTGVFTSAIVDKVTRGELTFRVRQGTPGSGYPGNVQGWLPLAVASIPVGSSSTDDITFWDVRPMIADRWNAPFKQTWLNAPSYQQLNLYSDRYTTPTETKIGGQVLGELLGSFAGGILSKGTPTVPFGTGDLIHVDAQNAENQDPAYTGTVGAIYYVWLLFPEGLPRWARYSENPISGQRLPLGCRGIAAVSLIGPNAFSNKIAASAITPPTSTGLTASSATQTGLLAACGVVTSTAVPGSFVADGDWISLENDTGLSGIAPVTSTNTRDTYQLTAGTHFPLNARAVRVRFTTDVQGTVGIRYTMTVSTVDTSGNYVGFDLPGGRAGVFFFDTPNDSPLAETVEIPRIPPSAFLGVPTTLDFFVDWTFATTGGTFTGRTATSATVVGWKLGG